MLFLLFQLGQDGYALDANQVVEVLPLVAIKELPQPPPGVVGMFNCHGTPVPVVDLSLLSLGRPSERRLSTRIVLVNHTGVDGAKHLLGLIAEKATETLRRDPGDFVASGVTSGRAAYLGPVVVEKRGLIQWIEVNKLLPAETQEALFRQPVEAT